MHLGLDSLPSKDSEELHQSYIKVTSQKRTQPSHDGGALAWLRPRALWCARHHGCAAERGAGHSNEREAHFQVIPALWDLNPPALGECTLGWLLLLFDARRG